MQADRHDHGVGAEVLGDDHADEVAAEEADAALPPSRRRLEAQDQRPVAVAVGRDDRIERAVLRQASSTRAWIVAELAVVDVLGVDRDEGLAAAGGDDLGAEPPRISTKQIAADRRVLVDEEAHALRALRPRRSRCSAGRRLARAASFSGGSGRAPSLNMPPRVEGRFVGGLGVELAADLLDARADGRLVLS